MVEGILDAHRVQADAVHLTLRVIAIRIDNSGFAFSIRHWFIVTIFALFYGVLKWVYRKRGRADRDIQSSLE